MFDPNSYGWLNFAVTVPPLFVAPGIFQAVLSQGGNWASRNTYFCQDKKMCGGLGGGSCQVIWSTLEVKSVEFVNE